MSDIPVLISDLAIILFSAGLITILFKWLKQPVVLGYIMAGIIAGPYTFGGPRIFIFGLTSGSFSSCLPWDLTLVSKNS